MKWVRILTVVGLGLLAAGVAPGQQTLLIHLPSVPVESAGSQADAITKLSDYLAEALPDLSLEPKIFRRLEDAMAYLDDNSGMVALTLSDAALVADLSAASQFQPYHRFTREGQPTYRRLIVVRTDNENLEKLVDLRGRTLAVVETAANGSGAFLRDQVFENELDPPAWFSEVVAVADDFAATASVLYGQTDAALVAEYNPLLSQHLGQELKVLYESPRLSLPVLSLSSALFGSDLRSTLDRILGGIADDPRAGPALAELGIDGFSRVSDRSALLGERTAAPSKRFEIALPTTGDLNVAPPEPIAPDQMPWTLEIELPELTIDPEALDG